MPIGRSRRRGMVVGAAVASTRANKRAALANQANSQPVVPTAAAPSDADTQIIEIQKFFELKNQGVITEEEFNAKKRQILGI